MELVEIDIEQKDYRSTNSENIGFFILHFLLDIVIRNFPFENVLIQHSKHTLFLLLLGIYEYYTNLHKFRILW